MSRHKRKRKPSRRQRRAGVDRPVQRPADLSAAGSEPDAAAGPDVPDPGTAEETVAEAPGPQPTVTATFQSTAKSEAAVTLEQRYISHDLRRLGIQVAAFVGLLAILAVLQAQTDVVGHLGSWLFTLWN